MTRVLLLLLAFLIGLVAYDRLGRLERAREVLAQSIAPPPPLPSRTVVAPPAAARAAIQPSSGTPTLDLLARLEGRRRLDRARAATYFDSLFVDTDSVVRRWPDQQGTVFTVAVPSDSVDTAPLQALVRRALASWENGGLGLQFKVTGDTAGAQIVVRMARQLGEDRAGQTDLQWTRDGAILSALITLGREDDEGKPLPDNIALAVAVHEVGHALGLAHSPRAEDVMFSATRIASLSPRDKATFRLLYELPLGTIRENAP